MDHRISGALRDRSRRPVRNKRCSRKVFGNDKKPQKRLFTPEIKRYLKEWLIRRRDNPYPNRDEKKLLAIQTGLTYIQVCNWFANWRRKLKNAGKEPQRKTWGNLIKTYNNQVRGNVEHFSICSDDSIWQEGEESFDLHEGVKDTTDETFDQEDRLSLDNVDICNNNVGKKSSSSFCENGSNNSKYKNHIMEKYLRDCRQKPADNECPSDSEDGNGEDRNAADTKPSSMISKWIESAQNFQPSEYSYVQWSYPKVLKRKSGKPEVPQNHGREELDAAEALTTLALLSGHSVSK